MQHRKSKGLLTFLAIAFGGSWAAQIGIAMLLRQKNLIPEEMRAYALPLTAPLLMWPPAMGAFVARKWVEKSGFDDVGLRFPSRKWLALSWAMPIVLIVATMLVSLPFNPPDTEITMLRDLFAKAGKEPPMPLGRMVLVQALAGVTIGAVINSVFAFGEEFGWRGYLLPRLIERLGTWPGILLHGAIWGIWHAPLIALIGYNYPTHPYLGVLLFVVFCTVIGILFAWLQLGSRSIVAPTLAHATLNAIAAIPMLVLKDVDAAWSGTISSVVGIVVTAASVAVLLRKSVLRKAFALG